jgi:hypothetical protein
MSNHSLSASALRFAPLLALSLACTTGLAGAQSLVTAQGRFIASNDDLAPGFTGVEFFGGASTFDTGALTDDGRAFFRARVVNGSQTAINDRALFFGSSLSNLVKVLQSGDQEPSGTIPGATMNTATLGGISGSVRISGNGNHMLFGTALSNGGVTTTTDTALYVGSPTSGWSILAREGDPAPGTAGATFSTSFSSPSTQNTGINNNGFALFKSTLVGGDVAGTTNNEALFAGTAGNLQLVLRKGDTLSNGEVVAGVMPSFISQLNNLNHVLFDISLVQGSGTPAVDATNDRALMLYVPGGGLLELVREGDSGVYPGTILGNATNTWSPSVPACGFTNTDQAVLSLQVAGSATVGIDDQAIYVATPSGIAPILRKGDAVPGLPGVNFSSFNNFGLGLNDNGQLFIQVGLTGAVTLDDDTAMFVTDGAANIQMIAREGSPAPGSGGAVWSSFSGTSAFMNGKGQVQFVNNFVGGAFVGSCTYQYDRELGLRPLVLSGETIEIQPGNPQVTSGSGGVQFNNGDARPLTYASTGRSQLRLTYEGGRASIVVTDDRTLNGRPASLSVGTGGTHTLYTNVGSFDAGRLFLTVATLSGTSPGIVLDGLNVPLNPDALTNLSIVGANQPPFANTFGFLNDAGQATGTVTIPPGTNGLANQTIHFATLVIDISVLPQVVRVTNASSLSLVP